MSDIPRILSNPDFKFNVFQCDNLCYKQFNESLKKELNKSPDNIQNALYELVDANLVFLGIPENFKNLVLAKAINDKSNSVVGIFINIFLHDVLYDGTSSNMSKIVYSAYFALVYDALLKNMNYNTNPKLFDMVYKYFNYMLIKNLKLSDLYSTKKIIFEFLSSYFFYKCYAKLNHNQVIEIASKNIEAEFNISEAINLDDLKIYNNAVEFFDVLPYYNVVNITPNSLKHTMSQSLGVFLYFMMFSEATSFVSSIVLSRYSHLNFKNLNINGDLSLNIEKNIESNYLNKLKIDIKSGKMIVDKFKNQVIPDSE